MAVYSSHVGAQSKVVKLYRGTPSKALVGSHFEHPDFAEARGVECRCIIYSKSVQVVDYICDQNTSVYSDVSKEIVVQKQARYSLPSRSSLLKRKSQMHSKPRLRQELAVSVKYQLRCRSQEC
jgi:hypothetical protein